MTEHISVRVPAHLYRALYPHAAQRRMDVGELVAELAVAQLMAKAAAQPVNPRARTRRKELRVRMTPQLLERVRQLHADGHSYAEIAQLTGVSRTSVAVYVQRIVKGEL